MPSDIIRSPRSVTYCSFADDTSCLGVCVLTGSLDPASAAQAAWDKGINPGGQLLAFPCLETDSDVPLDIFEAMWNNRDRLIPKKEAEALFEAKSIRYIEQVDKS